MSDPAWASRFLVPVVIEAKDAREAWSRLADLITQGEGDDMVRYVGDPWMGPAMRGAKRYETRIVALVSDKTLEVLSRFVPCEECGERDVDPMHVGADGRSVCDNCRDREATG